MASSTSVWEEKIYSALAGIDDLLSYLSELEEISDKLDALDDLANILSVVENLKTLVTSLGTTVTSIDSKLTTTNDRLNVIKTLCTTISGKADNIITYLRDISDATSALLNPVQTIKNNTNNFST